MKQQLILPRVQAQRGGSVLHEGRMNNVDHFTLQRYTHDQTIRTDHFPSRNDAPPSRARHAGKKRPRLHTSSSPRLTQYTERTETELFGHVVALDDDLRHHADLAKLGRDRPHDGRRHGSVRLVRRPPEARHPVERRRDLMDRGEGPGESEEKNAEKEQDELGASENDVQPARRRRHRGVQRTEK